MTFLVTENGQPFTEDHFTEWFGARRAEAGLLTGLTPHGPRKAACRRLAEAGCSAPVIASISGHTSLAEIERYIVEAERAKMARLGIAAIGGTDQN